MSAYSVARAAPDFGAFDDDDDDEVAAAGSGSSAANPHPPLLPTHHSHRLEPTPPVQLPGGYDFEPQNPPAPPPVNQRSRPSFNRARTESQSRSRSASLAAALPQSYHQRLLSLRDRIPFFASSAAPPAPLPRGDPEASGESEGEGHRLLFSHEDDDDDNEDGHRANSYPPPASHIPLPPRPPTFAAPPIQQGSGRVIGGGQGNDGVFANLSAKPEGARRTPGGEYVGGDDDGYGDKDEVLPAYEVAALDSTPPYWETTVITPQGLLGPDDICVDGLPVGNVFSFAWNLLVSMSFQFVGFLLTYLLHTTHAAKNGSRAGLGITLIQLGFYLKQRVDHPELFLNEINGDATGLSGAPGPNDPNSPDDMQGWTWWGAPVPVAASPTDALGETAAAGALAMATGTLSALGSLPTQLHGALSGVLDASDPDAVATVMPSLTGGSGDMTGVEVVRISAAANEWIAFFLVTAGSFLLIGGCLSYWRAVRFARAVRQGMDAAAVERSE